MLMPELIPTCFSTVQILFREKYILPRGRAGAPNRSRLVWAEDAEPKFFCGSGSVIAHIFLDSLFNFNF